jgi:hypothetical protein
LEQQRIRAVDRAIATYIIKIMREANTKFFKLRKEKTIQNLGHISQRSNLDSASYNDDFFLRRPKAIVFSQHFSNLQAIF